MKRIVSAALLVCGPALAGPLPYNPTPATLTPASIPQQPTLRAPTANDDALLGYPVGKLWLAPGGNIYTANQVLQGNAAWQPPTSTQGLPVDVMPTATLACSLDQLTSAYSANKAVDVVRASDGTTKTIGFVSGRFDSATVSAFLAGTTGTISQCYDQSGNGFNLTQATVANQPALAYTVGLGWAIVFNSIGYTGNTAKYMSYTFATGFDPATNTTLVTASEIQGSSTTTNLLNFGTTWNVYTAVLSAPGLAFNTNVTSVVAPSSPAITIHTVKNLTTNLYANDVMATSNTSNPGTLTALQMATSQTTTYGPSNFATRAWIFYNRALTATDIPNIQHSLSAMYGIPFQTSSDVVVADGDSITFGLGATYTQGWATMMLPMLNRPVTMYNYGVSGITAQGKATGEAAAYAKIYSPTARNFIVLVLLGTNDIGTLGSTAAQTYGYLQAYLATIEGLGPNVRVIASTVLPRSGAALTTTINQLNVLIRAEWNVPQASGGLGASALAEYAADQTLATCGTSATVCPGQLHPSDYGNSFMAPIAAKAINSVMQ